MRELKVYNTLTRKKETFVPVTPGQVKMYVCGITPYNHSHMGNARPFVTWDVIQRYLEHLGYEVTHIQNFTDVDDKIINAANGEGVSWDTISNRYIAAYFDVMDKLHIRRADRYPRVSEHMDDIIEMVQGLVDKGDAYVIDNDVYYSVEKFDDYGELSGRSLDDMEAGARIEVDDRKHNPMDFALWKGAKPGEPAWDSPWGKGRPGWHIECSAMSHRYLDGMFDIHGGGLDLRFPHHENEMAQTRAAGYESAARWMHSAWVTAKGEKMSKSLGTGLSVPSVLAEHSAWVVRYALGSVQYRSMLEWSDQALVEAQAAYERIMNFIERAGVALGEQPERAEIAGVSADDLPADFVSAMNDDVNVSGATAAIFTAIRNGNTLLSKLDDRADGDAARAEVRSALVAVRAMLDALGLDPLAEPWAGAAGADGNGESHEHDVLDALITEQLNARAEARKSRDFAKADAIRDALGAAGIAIEDGPQGSTWSLK